MQRIFPQRYHFEAFLSNTRLLPMAALVGLLGGLVGALYVTAMNSLTMLFWPAPWADRVNDFLPTPFSTTITWSNSAHWLVLIAAGLLTALGVKLLGDPGDTELLVDNIHVHGGAPAEGMRQLRALIPISLINIAAGSGIGPEAPLSQTNGTIGSWLANRWGLTEDETRILTITGMAAGFTVLFAAPLGAAVFALELLHRKGLRYFEVLLPALTGSIVGYAVYSSLTTLGLHPVWNLDTVLHLSRELTAVDFAWGVAAGVVGAIIATAFTYLFVLVRRLYSPLPALTKPIVTGVLLGALAFLSPYALTFSELQLMHLGLLEKVTVGTLLLAVVAKLLAVAVSMAGGWKGGFIIPMFFSGYCLGRVGSQVLPGHPNAVVLAICLMVSINVGVTKTPIGSTLVVTEMAGLRLLPPAMIAALVSFFLTSNVYLISSQQRRDSIHGEESEQAPTPLADEMGVGQILKAHDRSEADKTNLLPGGDAPHVPLVPADRLGDATGLPGPEDT
ncbi:MAG: chloride channel protein [Ilumatobacteraceae bacterium]